MSDSERQPSFPAVRVGKAPVAYDPARADDLAAEVEPWLRECGSCDAGLLMGCTCPPGDYRVILLKVWRAYEEAMGVSRG